MNNKYESKISEMSEEELKIISSNTAQFTELNKKNIQKKFDKLSIKKVKRFNRFILKGSIALACSLLLIVGGVNTNESFAQTIYKVPVVGEFAKLITIDRLRYTSENSDIDIEIASIEGIEDEALQKEINEMLSDKSIELYDKSIEASEDGREAVFQNYNVKRNDEEMLVFGVTTTKIKASAYETSKYYNIDLKNSRLLKLKDIFIKNSDYTSIIDNEILELMKSDMQNQEKSYFVEEFKGIDENTNFYINENSKLVIVFDEYSIAPGYMGMPEFEIDSEIIKDILSIEKYIN